MHPAKNKLDKKRRENDKKREIQSRDARWIKQGTKHKN